MCGVAGGTLLVCGGLSGLVGLGDTCRIEPRSHNQGECPSAAASDREPLLSEVVALGEAGVHLLPFSEPAGRGVTPRAGGTSTSSR